MSQNEVVQYPAILSEQALSTFKVPQSSDP